MTGKLPVQFNDGSKTKTAFMQVAQDKGPAKIKIFESDSSKRPKNEIELTESYTEFSPQDTNRKTLLILTATQNYNIIFNNSTEAEEYLKIFNSKSNICQDASSVKALDDQILEIWPFPQNDLFF